MGESFKHISVTAAEDDEVIVAGISEAARGGSAEVSEQAAAQEPGQVAGLALEPAPESDLEAVPEAGAGPASELERGGAQAPESLRAARPSGNAHAHSASRDDGYHETTLADLEGEGMPLAQKIVIAAAVICIIGALVYYFAVMR